MIHTPSPDRSPRFGLLHWMERTVQLADQAQFEGPSVEGVHDLRVAVRRSLSLVRGFSEIDGWPVWKSLRRLGRPLFKALGELRDLHVLRHWLERLSPENDPLGLHVRQSLDEPEERATKRARRALERFDRGLWLEGGRRATLRTEHLQPDGLPFQHTALLRLEEATEQHQRAVLSGRPEDYHALRICLKRVRYTLENFLPRLHRRWKRDLKRAQDILGDLHDIDIAWQTLKTTNRKFPGLALEPWRAIVVRHRQDLLVAYLGLSGSKNAMLDRLRDSLPEGDRLEVACLAHLGAWASFLTPDYLAARRVAGLAVRILDGIREAGVSGPFLGYHDRRVLFAAALTHGTGKTIRLEGHHKKAFELVKSARPPLGWTRKDMLLTALVVRYQKGAGPKKRHEPFRRLSLPERQAVVCLAGILRQAILLEPLVEQPRCGVEIETRGEEMVIRASLKAAPGNGPGRLPVTSDSDLLAWACSRAIVVEPLDVPPSPTR